MFSTLCVLILCVVVHVRCEKREWKVIPLEGSLLGEEERAGGALGGQGRGTRDAESWLAW